MNNLVEVGKQVKFNPKDDYWLENYSPDGVQPGDKGTVVATEDDGDVVVNFIRKDGTICEGFYAFPEDVEVVDE